MLSMISAIGDVADKLHVMLNHQNRVVLGDHPEQFRRFLPFCHRHARYRLIQHQQIRFLNQQHANLQPLFLAVAEQRGRLVQGLREEDGFRHAFHRLNNRRIPLESQCAYHAVALWIGNLEVLKYSQVLKHRRGLEFPAHARMDNLVLFEFG